jgi:hypothetical protein
MKQTPSFAFWRRLACCGVGLLWVVTGAYSFKNGFLSGRWKDLSPVFSIGPNVKVSCDTSEGKFGYVTDSSALSMGRRSLLDHIDQSDDDNRKEWLKSVSKQPQQVPQKTSTVSPPSMPGFATIKSSSDISVADGLTQEAMPLLDMLRPASHSGCDPDQMSPAALAYIGDNVFELYIRSRYVWPARKMSKLQDIVVRVVRGA